ncbi:MAG: DsbA family oxidoreductase [Deltaproteobacteria bacterium]|nr:DsbA family oxidoreductase [Deltaproteobacteria bacterium]
MKIDVWYDVVCPWCWLGKARLDAAVSGRTDLEVVTHAFELDASMPKDLDVPTSDLVAKKYGISKAQLEGTHARLVAMGKELGIDYHFEKVRSSNTFDAHQLVHHARANGGEAKANDVVDRLFQANFREGRRVAERDVLLGVAEAAGLDRADVAAALDEARYGEAVRADQRRARELGVSGVPFFLVDGKRRVEGAQSVEALREAITRGG